MKENKKIVTALDIGSSKILAVVAEVYKDGTFRVLSQGRTDSAGVLDGNVTNLEEVQPQVKAALVEAFGIAGKMAGTDICTNISGKSVEGVDSSAEMPLRGRTVTLMDMKNVQNMAQDALELKDDQRLIKSELLYYMLDNQDEGFVGQNPLNARSSRISAHMHSAVASASNALARVKVIRRNGMDISRMLPEAWASGYAVLTEDEIQNGVVVIDIGAGTTDVAVFMGGLPRYTYTLNYGGRRITQRISGYLHCTMQEAEAIKARLDLNCPAEDADVILYRSPIEEGNRKYSKLEISKMVYRELRNLNLTIGKKLFEAGWYTSSNGAPCNTLTGGIVLTGGTALLMGITELFSDMPGPMAYTFSTRLGRSRYTGDACIGLSSPKESAVMGLIAYEAMRFKEGEEGESEQSMSDNSLWAKAKRFVTEFFVGQY
ncbi:MAG TPA: cell division protein FtsA [Candidatus Aphodousia faecigallinarum]|uniref:Cell division protein FtsA n=1 Tax=Candidatus Aphodousia faecigallinarum TaxID=2840677 RepID=A0A9D1IK60_9BURK|nr:cell division protein FtsA [Candidatus Aphodousia faecigallinarum]